ncbi:MAG: DUF1016 domain-containing protein [Coriobacteriales bacterium]|jgi:hypothetical protein|nr:DUF1016 domain-containing protein [Coriobacteriales bacterium]
MQKTAVRRFFALVPARVSDPKGRWHPVDANGPNTMKRSAGRALRSGCKKPKLGQGFAFVGRQIHFEVSGDDFFIDLLFYHLKLRCFVVIELKASDFEPDDASQLYMYKNVVDDIFKHPDDKLTIGLLLVKGKNKTVVRYSLKGYSKPIGVADWQEELTAELPDDLKSKLLTIDEIERKIEAAEFVQRPVAQLSGGEGGDGE